MLHIIPSDEATLHEQSQFCVCGPVIDVDENTGELVYIHLPLTTNLKGISHEHDEHNTDEPEILQAPDAT